MGGSNTKLDVQAGAKKKIVIVGGSFGGKILTQCLQALDPNETQLEITIVDKNEHFEFICTQFLALAEDDQFKKNSIPFVDSIKFFKSDRVKFVQGKLVKVDA